MARRLVLDTDVIVAALRSDAGASRRLLSWALEQQFTLLVSVPLMLEYEAVGTRTEHLEVAGLTEDDIGAILDASAAVCEQVRLSFLWRPTLPDPEDDMVLETAANGGADLLVTFNRRHFAPAGEAMGIAVVGPGEAVRALEKEQ